MPSLEARSLTQTSTHFYHSEMVPSKLPLLYVNPIKFWRNLMFYVSYYRETSQKLHETIVAVSLLGNLRENTVSKYWVSFCAQYTCILKKTKNLCIWAWWICVLFNSLRVITEQWKWKYICPSAWTLYAFKTRSANVCTGHASFSPVFQS